MRRARAGLITTMLLLLLPANGAHAQSAGSDDADTATVTFAEYQPEGWKAGAVSFGTGDSRPGGSERVRGVQRALRALRLSPGAADGIFGPQTEAAVRRFQQQRGLVRDGIVGATTLRALQADARAIAVRVRSAGTLRTGAGYRRPGGSHAVRAAQKRLVRADTSPGRVDGLFGPRTERAVERFQKRHGLVVDGIVGPKTLRALGQGDDQPAKRTSRNVRGRAGDVEGRAPRGRSVATETPRPTGTAKRAGPDQSDAAPVAPREPARLDVDLPVLGFLGVVGLALVGAAAARRRAREPRSGNRKRALGWARSGAQRWQRRRAPVAVPLEENLAVRGKSSDPNVGSFRGFALATASTEPGSGTPRLYLVHDPRKPNPVWVEATDIRWWSPPAVREAKRIGVDPAPPNATNGGPSSKARANGLGGQGPAGIDDKRPDGPVHPTPVHVERGTQSGKDVRAPVPRRPLSRRRRGR